MDEDEKRALLEEVLLYSETPCLQSHEFTVKDYVEAYREWHDVNLPENRARNMLNRLVEKGVLDKRMVFHQLRWRHAYSKPKGNSERRGNEG